MSEEIDPGVIVSTEGSVGIIALDRPAKFNALTRRGWQEVAAGIERFEQEGEIRAILIRANGPNFCSGGDLVEAKEMMASSTLLSEFLDLVNKTMSKIESSPLPVVAACRGLVLAGGLELILACDVVFAADGALFADQHVQYGLVPAWGASQRLPRAIGLGRSLDLMYSGRRIGAPTAQEWGMVQYVIADHELDLESIEYCRTVAGRSRPGIAAMKALARASYDLPIHDGLKRELFTVIAVMNGPDPAEGIAAFEQRRRPSFH